MSRVSEQPPHLMNGAPPPASERFLHYKKELHERLIASMDLSEIGTMGEAELRVEVRRAAGRHLHPDSIVRIEYGPIRHRSRRRRRA